MATTSPDTGAGTTITFATSNFDASVISIGDLGEERPAIDTTHLATSNARTSMPGALRTSRPITLEVTHDSSKIPPISAAAESITITLPDTSTCGFTGYCSSYTVNGVTAEEAMMTASMTVTVSGVLTWTPA